MSSSSGPGTFSPAEEEKGTHVLFLVDSFAQIYRGYYAVRGLTGEDGFPSNAIFAMMKFLMKMHAEHPSEYGAFVFDEGKPPHRLQLAPLYKANRPPMPEDLKVQLPLLEDLIDAFGWKRLRWKNWEADDLIAVICGICPDRKIRIVSADKDLAQLVDSRVCMLVPDKDSSKGFSIRGESEVREKFGVHPSEIVDYLAMIGDASDNIPGLEGVGPKTAARLISRFGSIESILLHAEEIPQEKLREKIRSASERLRTNIELVKLVRTPPEGCDWNESSFRREPADFPRILEIAERLRFRSLIRELTQMMASATLPASDPESGPESDPESASRAARTGGTEEKGGTASSIPRASVFRPGQEDPPEQLELF